MWHTILIGAHALAGGVSLLAGLVAIGRRTPLFGVYLWAMVAMAALLVAAVVEEWTTLDVAAQALFVAFAVLAGVMVWRAEQARRLRPATGRRPVPAYVNHMGFTLIALFDAFVVILVLNAGAPVWLVVVAGVAIGVAGHYVLVTARRRITTPPAGTARAGLVSGGS